MKKIIKNILFTIITIILLLILSFNVYNMICTKILGKDLTKINGYALLEVVSGSMEPTIDVGDMIIIDTNSNDYQVGDIVTFYDVNGSFVTHRIVEVRDTEIVTKGDYVENSIDDPTSKDKIVGKYVTKIHGAGKLLAAFKTPFVMIMILFIGILVCFLVSTDKEGKPILTNEEIEFMEFKEYKKSQKKNENKTVLDNKKSLNTKKNTSKKTPTKKTTSSKKNSSTKTTPKKSTTKKTTNKKK